MKLKKGIPVIDQGNKLGFWGNKFGGNFVPETLNFILNHPHPPKFIGFICNYEKSRRFVRYEI